MIDPRDMAHRKTENNNKIIIKRKRKEGRKEGRNKTLEDIREQQKSIAHGQPPKSESPNNNLTVVVVL